MQYLISLSDGLIGYTFPLYNILADQKPPVGSTKSMHALGPLKENHRLCNPYGSQVQVAMGIGMG